MNISIINSGSGNISSLKNMLDYLGHNSTVCERVEDIKNSNFIFLPGVGSFDKIVKNLKKNDFYDFLRDQENYKNSVLVGICIGMHVLFEKSEEGTENGLNLLNGKVKKISNKNLKVPHMGWNNVYGKKFFPDLNNEKFYFAHSYYVDCKEDYIFAYSDYSIKFPAIVKKKNFYGIQSHPEKSNQNGFELLKKILI